MGKLNFRFKEVGRLNFKDFLGIYNIYKNTFDYELRLTLNGKTYKEIERKQQASADWDF